MGPTLTSFTLTRASFLLVPGKPRSPSQSPTAPMQPRHYNTASVEMCPSLPKPPHWLCCQAPSLSKQLLQLQPQCRAIHRKGAVNWWGRAFVLCYIQFVQKRNIPLTQRAISNPATPAVFIPSQGLEVLQSGTLTWNKGDRKGETAHRAAGTLRSLGLWYEAEK